MKYLLLLLVLAVLALLWGARRARPRSPEARTPPPPPAGPQAMLRCAECGMHLPVDEALPGKGGAFCSAAHRASFEAR
jgi:uncharacterized protein